MKNSLDNMIRVTMQRYFSDVSDDSLVNNLMVHVMDQVEKPLLDETLQYNNGNCSKTAKMLGINRNTLSKKIKRHQLERKNYK